VQEIEIEDNTEEKSKWNKPRRTIAIEQAVQEEQLEHKYKR
jgi:hypothetical protein